PLSPYTTLFRSANAQADKTTEMLIRGAVAAQPLQQSHQPDLLHVLAVEHLVGLQRQLTDDTLDQRQILGNPALLLTHRQSVMTGRGQLVAVVERIFRVHRRLVTARSSC